MINDNWNELARIRIVEEVYPNILNSKYGIIREIIKQILENDKSARVYDLMHHIYDAQHVLDNVFAHKTLYQVEHIGHGSIRNIKFKLAVLHVLKNKQSYHDWYYAITSAMQGWNGPINKHYGYLEFTLSDEEMRWIKKLIESETTDIKTYSTVDTIAIDDSVKVDNISPNNTTDVKYDKKKSDRSRKITLKLSHYEIIANAIIPNLTDKEKQTYISHYRGEIKKIKGTREEMDSVKNLLPIECQKNKFIQTDVDKVQLLIGKKIVAGINVDDEKIVKSAEVISPIAMSHTSCDITIGKSDHLTKPTMNQRMDLLDRLAVIKCVNDTVRVEIQNAITYAKKSFTELDEQLSALERVDVTPMQTHNRKYISAQICNSLS